MPKFKGSVRPYWGNAKLNQEASHKRLFKDHFQRSNPIFMEHIFWCYFWMSRKLFMQILDGTREHHTYFECKTDADGKLGFTSYLASLQVVGYLFDQYMCISETT
jgi:hypothetical protein